MGRAEVPLVVQQRAKRLAEQLERELDGLHPSVGGTGCDLSWLEADAPRMLWRLADGDSTIPDQTSLGTRAAGLLGSGPAVSDLLDVLFEVDRMVRGWRQSEVRGPVPNVEVRRGGAVLTPSGGTGRLFSLDRARVAHRPHAAPNPWS